MGTFGAHEELQLLMLLVAAAGLLLLADPLRIPYPILLVVGGLALGFVPGVPSVTLPPDAVLFGILPLAHLGGGWLAGAAGPRVLFIVAASIGLIATAWGAATGFGRVRMGDVIDLTG